MPANYTPVEQLKYICTWFDSWSELQKDDFLPILGQSLDPAKFVNGVNSYADISEKKRPTIFDCQVKLFNEWFVNWSEDVKNQFVNHIESSDIDFYKKLNNAEKSENGISSLCSLSINENCTNGAESPDDISQESPDSQCEVSSALTTSSESKDIGEKIGPSDDSDQVSPLDSSEAAE